MEETNYRINSTKQKRKRTVTPETLSKVNPENIKAYEQYLKSGMVRNKDVKDTTYKVYRAYFNIFLVYIMEHWDNFYILDTEFVEENMVDVMEGFMSYCVEELGNNKKAVNVKVATVSSFYHYAVKRRKLKSHPFAGRLDRMKNIHEEKIIAEYFLTQEQINEIEAELSLVDDKDYHEFDVLDRLMWKISFDSACRIGALQKLKISKFEYDNKRFVNIREKRGKIVSVPVTEETANLIKEHIKWRKQHGIVCDDLFYTCFRGEIRPMSVQTMSRRIKRIGHIVGLGDFRPHCIRKTRLNMIAKKDINLAKTLANHESLDTTSRFYTEKQDLSDVLVTITELENQE
ncbi:TPA: tyrosine-type recombinase/integrase [Streptococcus suis]